LPSADSRVAGLAGARGRIDPPLVTMTGTSPLVSRSFFSVARPSFRAMKTSQISTS